MQRLLNFFGRFRLGERINICRCKTVVRLSEAMKERLTRWFLVSCGVVLMATALAKLYSAFGDLRILDQPDPLFTFLTNRELLLLAALLELGVAWFLFRSSVGRSAKLLSIPWIAAVFACYRCGLWAVGYGSTCSCLGHLTDPLGISPESADLVAKGVLAYFLTGSIASFCFLENPARLAASIRLLNRSLRHRPGGPECN